MRRVTYGATSRISVEIRGITGVSAVNRVELACDATGVARAFSLFLAEKQIEHAAVTITAGAATSRKGRYHNVAKNVLLGDLANGLETRTGSPYEWKKLGDHVSRYEDRWCGPR